jgi:integrase
MERMIMAWLEKRKNKWVIYDRDGRGKKARIATAYSDRQASRQKLARYEKAKAHGAEGLIDPFEQHKNRPIGEHLTDYVADLKAKRRDDKYVENCQNRVERLIADCGWKILGDMTADGFCRWRETPIERKEAKSHGGRIGSRTANQYLEAVRAFCNWCVKRNRMAANPMFAVEKVDDSADVRRGRRALLPEELVRLMDSIPQHHRTVYQFFLATGMRRQETADLQWSDVRLDSPMPFLRLRAGATKSRRADCLPLRADLAGELRRMRGDASETSRVFPSVPTMEEHRGYLSAAGIDWTDDNGLRADVHALRHTYGTLLSQSGASPREAMELMRHTDLRLTMKVYTDPRVFNLAGAVERLPIPAITLPTVLRATGTDDVAAVSGDCQKEGAQEGATSTIEGHSTAPIGKMAGRPVTAASAFGGGDCQSLAAIGTEGTGTERVGIEPTSPCKAGRRRF